MQGELARFEAELARAPQVVARVLRELAPAAEKSAPVIVRCDAASVNAAIVKGLVVAVREVGSRVELTGR